MVYRIYIPALDPDGVSMTIDCEADNWMLALRYGLDEIGADRDLIKRAICDIKSDKSIHVMEPAQGRVFVLRELPAYEQATRPAEAPERAPTRPLSDHLDRVERTATPIMEITRIPEAAPVVDEAPIPEAETPVLHEAPIPEAMPMGDVGHPLGEPLRTITTELPAWATASTEDGFVDAETAESIQAIPEAQPVHRTHGLSETPTVQEMAALNDVTTSAPPMADLQQYPLNEADLEKYFDVPAAPRRTISHLDLGAVIHGGPVVVGRTPSTEITEAVRKQLSAYEEDNSQVLARVFEDMAEIDFVANSVEGALQYALELAVQRIPSEAGWLLLADLNRRDLYFATATGPKAEEVFNYRLPMGRGIAGFCAVNGVSLSLSDVEQDPRFQTTVSQSVGYRIDSVACAPVQFEGRVYGAIQIMNHRGRSEYTPGELDVLNYIARRTAEYLSQHVELA